MTTPKEIVRVAALGDLHYPKIPQEVLQGVLTQATEQADVLLLNRYAVTAVFHSHAHHGTPEGQTTGGIPVYNVAVPLLHKAFPARPLFRLVEIPVTPQ